MRPAKPSPQPSPPSSTIFFDYALRHQARECAAQAVSAGSELLLSCPAADDDCRFRALIALGTLVLNGSAECKSLASDLGLADVAEALRVSGGTERTREAAGDLKLAMSR